LLLPFILKQSLVFCDGCETQLCGGDMVLDAKQKKKGFQVLKKWKS
jgi:hypothetical protein